MASTVLLPKLNFTMENGTIVEWHKNIGDRVENGDTLAEVTTDKVNMEVESTESGVLMEIFAQPGDVVEVLKPIAIIGEPGEDIENLKNEVYQALGKAPEVNSETSKSQEQPAKNETKKVRATPKAKKLAKEHNLDLAAIFGGSTGRIIEAKDITDYLSQLQETSNSKEVQKQRNIIPLTPMRKAIGERLRYTLETAASAMAGTEICFDKVSALRKELNGNIAPEEVRITYTDFLVKACAEALKKNPYLNATMREEGIELLSDINIGFAVPVEEGLLVPVIGTVQNKNIQQIASGRLALHQKVKSGQALPSDLTGGTFTISNMGVFEVDYCDPIINPPEAGILGIGRIRERVGLEDGKLITYQSVFATLVYDHRILDGATAAAFLGDLKNLLENPDLLVK